MITIVVISSYDYVMQYIVCFMYCTTNRSELGKNINTDEAAALGTYVQYGNSMQILSQHIQIYTHTYLRTYSTYICTVRTCMYIQM